MIVLYDENDVVCGIFSCHNQKEEFKKYFSDELWNEQEYEVDSIPSGIEEMKIYEIGVTKEGEVKYCNKKRFTHTNYMMASENFTCMRHLESTVLEATVLAKNEKQAHKIIKLILLHSINMKKWEKLENVFLGNEYEWKTWAKNLSKLVNFDVEEECTRCCVSLNEIHDVDFKRVKGITKFGDKFIVTLKSSS